MSMAQYLQDISSAGDTAWQVIQRNSTARVAGTSSRGIYLQPGDDLTLYLSREKFQGPLTLVVAGQTDLPGQLEPGLESVFQKGKILFPDLSLQFSLESARIWRPPEPDPTLHSRADLLVNVGQQITSLAEESPFYSLLEMALSEEPFSLPDLPGFETRLGQVLEILRGREITHLTNALIDLLGAGPGLTPLGDDLILGLTLAFNRGGEAIYPKINLINFNQTILGAAREKTTHLSFSLLSCAARGDADERLIQVLDAILTGSRIPDQDLVQLLDWGSSSGVAVLAGMILAINKDTVS